MQSSDLLRLADQCVKCGYCLPHCPTFRLYRDEGESPRGRIALMQGLLSGELAQSDRLQAHLDHCLQCRACEPACPSLVQYGQLMDGVRAWRAARMPGWRRALPRLRLALFSRPDGIALLAALAGLYRQLRLSRLVARWRQPRLQVLDGLITHLQWPWQRPLPSGPAAGAASEAPVGLFLGCVSRALQPQVLDATVQLLSALRIPVTMPSDQGCCGALHRHEGLVDQADRLLARNAAAFGDRRVVGVVSACVAELGPTLDAVELCRFLLDAPWPEDLTLRRSSQTVLVHASCSHRNRLRDTAAVPALLQRIPGLRVLPLPGNDQCCGAAGSYMLRHPATALELGDEKVRHIRRLIAEAPDARRVPSVLVTTNSGCAVHLASRIRAAGLDIEVLHPVELLARHLVAADPPAPPAQEPDHTLATSGAVSDSARARP
ncbi:(Fe-S)-binding protein [Thiohalocapsa marina]|uniref:(Fe-S)-binding protein n=1 Tax=Thiohalocapsa marina TaxID=424902 RepID=UPI001FEC1F29|nr:(Fe-S)-binding protein [Thiohalocapsa marina]